MKQKILSLAILATMLAGCSHNDEEVVSLKDTPIQVNVLMTDIQTRAGYDNTNQLSKFYLSIDQTGESYDYTNVVMRKNENGGWVAYESDAADATTIQMLWEGSKGNVTVTAATFPLGTASYALAVESDQSTDEAVKASDHLCYYSNEVTPSTDGISIAFDHIMSKLQISLTLGSEYEDETANPITAVTVLGTKLGATYDPTTSAWNTPTGGADIIYCLATAYSNPTATYEVILEPQTVAENSFAVRIQIGNRLYEWRSTNAVTLASGKQYTLALTAGKDKVSGNSFTAKEWGSGDNQDMQTE